MKYIYTVTGGPDCHSFEFVYDMFFFIVWQFVEISKRRAGEKRLSVGLDISPVSGDHTGGFAERQ